MDRELLYKKEANAFRQYLIFKQKGNIIKSTYWYFIYRYYYKKIEKSF